MDVKQVIYDAIVNSGLVEDEGDTDQLAMNIEDDIQDIPCILKQQIFELYNNGLGAAKIENLVQELAIADRELVEVIFEELSYWRKHDKHNLNNKSRV